MSTLYVGGHLCTIAKILQEGQLHSPYSKEVSRLEQDYGIETNPAFTRRYPKKQEEDKPTSFQDVALQLARASIQGKHDNYIPADEELYSISLYETLADAMARIKNVETQTIRDCEGGGVRQGEGAALELFIPSELEKEVRQSPRERGQVLILGPQRLRRITGAHKDQLRIEKVYLGLNAIKEAQSLRTLLLPYTNRPERITVGVANSRQ